MLCFRIPSGREAPAAVGVEAEGRNLFASIYFFPGMVDAVVNATILDAGGEVEELLHGMVGQAEVLPIEAVVYVERAMRELIGRPINRVPA
jgi:hypothetical protein